QTCSLLFAVVFFRPTNRGCRPWGNSWVRPHLRRNSLKRLTRRRKHPRRGPASRRIHELVQLGEICRPDRDRKDLWMPLPNCSDFLNSVHAWPRTLINNARFRSLYGLNSDILRVRVVPKRTFAPIVALPPNNATLAHEV